MEVSDKVLIDRELLSRAADVLGSQSFSAWDEIAEQLRAFIAQPAEEEGVELQRLAAEFDAAPDDAEWEPPHPIFQMARDIDRATAALSAVTAERDRLRAVLEGAQYQNIARLNTLTVEECRQIGETVMRLTIGVQKERDQLRAEVEALRKDAERYRFLCDPEDADENYLAHAVNTLNAWADKSEIDQAVDAALAAKDGEVY